MVDNFEQVKNNFYFNEADKMFFYLTLVTRKKDGRKNGMVASYCVTSKNHLESLKEEIIMLCEQYGARAYIVIAGKEFYKMNRLLMQELATDILNDNVRNTRKMLDHIAGKTPSNYKLRMIDIDDLSQYDAVKKWIKNYFIDNSAYYYEEFPSKTGMHIICSPFNTNTFNEVFPDIEVKKEPRVILYSPKSID